MTSFCFYIRGSFIFFWTFVVNIWSIVKSNILLFCIQVVTPNRNLTFQAFPRLTKKKDENLFFHLLINSQCHL